MLCKVFHMAQQDKDHQIPAAEVIYLPASHTLPAPGTQHRFSLSERGTPLAEGTGVLLGAFGGGGGAFLCKLRQIIFGIILGCTNRQTKPSLPQTKKKKNNPGDAQVSQGWTESELSSRMLCAGNRPRPLTARIGENAGGDHARAA